MRKIINYSLKYKQTGLEVQLKGGKITVTKGILSYDKKYTLDQDVSFDLDEKTVIIYLVEDSITGEVLVATSDGSIDKAKYCLIERLAWKTESGWEQLSIEPFPKPPKAGEYNYEGLDEEAIQKGLEIHPSARRVIRPDGKIELERVQKAFTSRKGRDSVEIL